MTNDSKTYKIGQSVLCKVEAPEVGGYRVTVSPGGTEGFLPSQDPLQLGRQIPATFVCMSGDRALLTFAYMIGTTERVQFSTSSDEINAFAVWADSYPSDMRLRRAIDIIMPPLDGEITETTSSETPLSALQAHLEKTRLTGCLKAQSEERLSRSAALIYQGRIVGCIYGTKEIKPGAQPYTMETSMNLMFSDLRKKDTTMQFYSLPEEVLLSMSSLFLGIPIEIVSDMRVQDATLALLKELNQRKDTACLTLSAETGTISVSFVYKGDLIGTFLVEKRQYLPAKELSMQLPESFDHARLDASFLPSVMTSESMQYGYMLNVVLDRSRDFTA